MAIIKLGPENFQNYELVANPTKTFESSSSGVTGSIALFADASTSLKDLDPTFGVSEEGYITQAGRDRCKRLVELGEYP